MDESQRVYVLRKKIDTEKGEWLTSMKVFEVTSEGVLASCVHIESVFEWIGKPISAFNLFSLQSENFNEG